MLALMALTASAQIKAIDVKGNLRGDFGIGGGFTADLSQYIEFSPSLNWYFCSNSTLWQLEGDFHYNIELTDEFTFYPIAGAGVGYSNPYGARGLAKELGAEDTSGLDAKFKVLGNIGAGLRYNIIDNVSAFVEAKYQWLKDDNSAYCALGIRLAL